jgi:hypothetical protein
VIAGDGLADHGAEAGREWGAYFAPLGGRFGECFPLPGGAGSRRAMAAGPADEFGGYPVLAVDAGGEPSANLAHPGFDVYLAHALGVIGHQDRHHASLTDHPLHGPRMRQHARDWLGGRVSAEYPFHR